LKDISFHASKGIQISDPAGGPVPPATGQGQAVRYNRAGHHQVDGEFTISRFPSLGSRVQILATAPKFLDYHHLKKVSLMILAISPLLMGVH
jgi:hypothetical protein